MRREGNEGRVTMRRNALEYHLDGATDDDLVLVAVHKGTAHSVVLKDADWTAIDDELAFELRAYALRAELDHRIASGQTILFGGNQ